MIELKHIKKYFHSGTSFIHAVNDVSLTINNGEIFGMIGFSGAGKSTLVRCINLLERPDEGEIYIDGLPLTKLTPKELRVQRKKIGMIFQHFNLLNSRTVAENIAYPLKKSGFSKLEIDKKVQQLLLLVNMEDKKNAYPRQLSGGQKQRVAIARALANNPKVLLCDEATSALDPQTTKAILQLLKQLNETLGITIIIITHEMAVVKEICHKVAVLENGCVVEQGAVYEIFATPKQPVTQQFIQATLPTAKIYDLLENNSPLAALKPGEILLHLSYQQRSVAEPLISTVSRNFNIDLNIISGNIEIIDHTPLGSLITIASGNDHDLRAALKYLKEKNVKVEVLKDGCVSNHISQCS